MDLLALFKWFEDSGLGRVVRESVWAFAVIESIHLIALVLLGGAALLVDMRLLHLGLRDADPVVVGLAARGLDRFRGRSGPSSQPAQAARLPRNVARTR